MNARVLKHVVASVLALALAASSLRETGSLYDALISFTTAYAVTVFASWLGLKTSRALSKRG
ncbi:MAG: hypothetical protein QXZ31_03800 [Thermofilaceae archaeon]